MKTEINLTTTIIPIFIFSLILIILFRFQTNIYLEDAFITFRYSQNLASGKGLVYNPGEKVLGITTPLWAVWLAFWGKILGIRNIPQIGIFWSTCFFWLNGWLLYQIGKKIKLNPTTIVFIVFLFYFQACLIWTGSGGMETALIILLMNLSLYTLISGQNHLTALITVLLLATRIDSLIWISLIWVVIFQKKGEASLKWLWFPILLILLYFGWLGSTYSSILPHSVIAKKIIGESAHRNPFSAKEILLSLRWYLSGLGVPLEKGLKSIPSLIWLGLICLGAKRIMVKKWSWGYPLILLPLVQSLVFHFGRAPRSFPWYLIPLTWSGIILACLGWEEIKFRSNQLGKYLKAGVLTILIITWGYLAIKNMIYWQKFQINENSTVLAIGLWLKENTSPGAIVATEGLGYQGYFSERKIIDLAGLISPAIVNIHRQSQTDAEAFFKILTSFKHDYLVLGKSEVEQNINLYGRPFFENDQQKSDFKENYQLIGSFMTSYPDLWSTDGFSIYAKKSP